MWRRLLTGTRNRHPSIHDISKVSIEFGEISKIYKQAQQAGKLGRWNHISVLQYGVV